MMYFSHVRELWQSVSSELLGVVESVENLV